MGVGVDMAVSDGESERVGYEREGLCRSSSCGVCCGRNSLPGERVGAGVAASGGGLESREAVGPATGVGVGHRSGQAVVAKPQPGAGRGGFERDLDGRGIGRDFDVGSVPSVGEHDSARPDELDEATLAGVAVGMGPADGAAGSWVECCGWGHPSDEEVGIDEVVVHIGWSCVDVDDLLDEIHPAFRRFARPRVSAACRSWPSLWPQKSSSEPRSAAKRSGSVR